jgi:beta-glucanase (GH16 family)
LEPTPCNIGFDGKTNTVGWHDENGNCSTYKVGEGNKTSATALFDAYHKYAVEWNTDRIIYYFDDVPFYSAYNYPSLTMAPQKVVIDLQIHQCCDDFNPAITFPQYMKIDYFRYYQLKKDCNNDAVINN